MNRTIRHANPADIPAIQMLATEIWHEVYPTIISMEQIDYMLSMMYSAESLQVQLTKDHAQFFLLCEGERAIGFASWSLIESGEARLHKLYVLPAFHGTGAGAALLHAVEREAMQQQCEALQLNVNKYNPARSFYQNKGYRILREEVIDIGSGYVMDDYVMHKLLSSAAQS